MAKLNSEKMGGFQGTDVTTGGQQVPSSHSLSLLVLITVYETTII